MTPLKKRLAVLTAALTLAVAPAMSASAAPRAASSSCGSNCYLTSRLVMVTKDTAQSYVKLHNNSSLSWCFYWDQYVVGTGHHYKETLVAPHSAPEYFEGYWPVVPPAYKLVATYPYC